MKKHIFSLAVLVSLVLPVSGFSQDFKSQTKVPVTVFLGDSKQLGYKRPHVDFRGGLEQYGKHYWVNVVGRFSPTDKETYGNLSQVGVTTELFWKHKSGAFLGGGATVQNLTFHDLNLSRTSFGPLVSGGLLVGDSKILVRGHVFQHDKAYKLSGVSWGVTHDFKKHFRVGFEQGIFRVNPKESGQKATVPLTIAVIIGFVF